MTDPTRFCTFTLAHHLYGIPVSCVRELLAAPRLTRVPPAPPVILGLLNLRGEIVTAVDLAAFLGLPAAAPPDHAVVVASSHGTLAFFVGAVREVVQVSDDRREPPPDTLPDPPRSLLSGVYQLDRGLLLALDVERTLHGLAGGP